MISFKNQYNNYINVENMNSNHVEEIKHVNKVLFLQKVQNGLILDFKAFKNFVYLVHWTPIKKYGFLFNIFSEAYVIETLKINHTYYTFTLLKLLSYMYAFYIWTRC